MQLPDDVKKRIEDKAISESSSPSDYEWLKTYYSFGYSLAQQKIEEQEKGLAYWKERCEAAERLLGHVDNNINKRFDGYTAWQSLKQKEPTFS